MGVLLTALLVDAMAVGCTCALLFWLAHRRGHLSGWRAAARWSVVAAPVCILLLRVPTAKAVWSSTVSRGNNAARCDFNGIGPALTAAAERITYYSDYGGCEAVFSVKECVIVAWAKQENWRVKEVSGGRSVLLVRLGISRTVTDGLFIEEQFSSRGTGVTLVFDRGTGDCFYRFNSY